MKSAQNCQLVHWWVLLHAGLLPMYYFPCLSRFSSEACPQSDQGTGLNVLCSIFLLVNGIAGILYLFSLSLSLSLSETHRVQTDTEMRVLLTGATGFLGGRLCSALVHSGHTVRVTVRAKSVTSELPPEVEIANCDIQDAPALIKACEGCDAVIHTAALVGSWLPDSSQFITVNVSGLRNVIDAVKANPSVKKLVYTSSFFALGYTDGHIGDEDQVHPGKFISPYEESKFLADKVAQEAAAEGVPIVSVYPGVVYGPGKLTAGNSLALMLIGRFKGQSPGYIGNGADKFSFCHVDDVASGHLAAMEIGKGGGRYLLCGDNASYVEIYDLAASLTHTKSPSFHIPFWALELAGHITVMWAHFSFCTGISKSVPTLTSTAVQILKHEWAYSSAKAERELGYKSRPLKEGLSELLAWLKATGRITY